MGQTDPWDFEILDPPNRNCFDLLVKTIPASAIVVGHPKA
jgi:hypothetical protein